MSTTTDSDESRENVTAVDLRPGYYSVKVKGTIFTVLERYQNLQKIGSGTHGTVCLADDTSTGTKVAIKKLFKPFRSEVVAKRAYRELKIMGLVRHENVMGLLNAFTPQTSLAEFEDAYLVMQWMPVDLQKVFMHQKITKQKFVFDHDYMSFMLHQMLRGVQYLHSVGIIHRDLKPANILANFNCTLKITDFGLGRSMESTIAMTEYVVTRWYRAPEIILGMAYDGKSDIWSLGCIFGEMILGDYLFTGENALDQWNKIVEKLGTPEPEFNKKLKSKSIRKYFKGKPRVPPQSFEDMFPDKLFYRDSVEEPGLTAHNARDLLSKMLVIDPDRRITIEQTLRHPYLRSFVPSKKSFQVYKPPQFVYDRSVEEGEHTVDYWKELIFNEIGTRNQQV